MPNRFIKESCRTSESLDALSDGAERMFWRLTTVADDFGRFEADPRILLANCFPLKIGEKTIAQVQAHFVEIASADLVGVYQVGSKLFGVFLSWDKHQTRRADKSKFPSPPVDKSEFLRIWESEQNHSDSICKQMISDAPVFVSESESESVSESVSEKAQPSAPSKIKNLYQQTEHEDLVHLARDVGYLDKVETRAGTTQQLCQWTISMVRCLNKEPPERVATVVRASLENVKAKIKSGYEIKHLWGLLDKIFNDERTKFIQGPEHEAHKHAPIPTAIGEIIGGLAKAKAMK